MVKLIYAKLILVLLVLLAGFQSGYAQNRAITGTVTDASNGETLPGVTILVKGTQTGTTTDMDGKYKISIDKKSILEFSFVGFIKQEIEAEPGATVNVALEVSLSELSEFVVIGYGVQKKSDATGSLTAIDAKEFNKGAITSPTDLIAGKIAGVQVTNSGGAPGSGTTIRIRGGASLNASNDPLIVIDGVPMDNDGIAGMRNPLNTINPNDIETFTVLKDASATAIYGSRASNGVILITTKKGAQGEGAKKFQVNYSGTFSFSTLPKTVDVLGADEFRSLVNQKHGDNESIIGLLGESNTDWQSEIYNNAFGMDHYLSIGGAVKTLPYRVSYGYSDQDGILKTDNLKRHTFSANINPQFFDDHLKVNINAKGMLIDNNFADRGAIGSAIQMDPTKPVNDPESPYGGYWTWTQNNGDPVTTATTNPLALLYMRDDNSKVKRFIGNAQLDYTFHNIPELRANLNLGYDHSKSDGSVYVPENAPWSYDALNGGGTDRVYSQEKKNEVLDFYLNYVKTIASVDSKFDVMAGYSWQHFYLTDNAFETNVAKTDTIQDVESGKEKYLISFFGRFNYTFKERYLLTFTFRNDNSSTFSPETRSGKFPSLALGWKIKDEPWMKDNTTFSQLKLRAGWGITGQQAISSNFYPYLPRYTYSEPSARYRFGDRWITTLRPEGYDANIKWEETTTYNAGLDFGFAQDRFTGSIDVYQKNTKDLINFIPVPAGSNLTNFILTNVGDMENKGIEFSITTKPIVKSDLIWQITFNSTYNKNKITKLTASDDPDYLGALTGGISGGVGNTIQIHSVGYPASSFFVYEQVYDNQGKPIEGLYVDRNGDGQITDEDRYHSHHPAADFYFGISSSVQYKNWNFSFSGRANFGNYVYNNLSSENGVYERLYRPEGNYIGNVTADVNEAGFTTPQYLSDYYIQDASFFSMDNIALNYNFGKLMNDKVGLSVSATVNNAFVITQYKGLDPEISGGIDNRGYPRPRVYVLGVNLTF